MNLRHALIDLRLLFGKRYTAEKCGHRTRRSGRITAFDTYRSKQMPLNNGGTVDWCLDCIGKMTIRCAWCGSPIFVADPITLYVPKKLDDLPEYAVRYGENPVSVVGCMLMSCADTGADRAGFWMPGDDGKGRVARVPSPLEIAMATGMPQTVGDVGSIPEAVEAAQLTERQLQRSE